MIVAVWFTIVFFILLVGFGVLIVSFWHWSKERDAKKRTVHEVTLSE